MESRVSLPDEMSIVKSLIDIGLHTVSRNQSYSPRQVVFVKLVQFIWVTDEKFSGTQKAYETKDIISSSIAHRGYYAVFYSDKYVYVIFHTGEGYRFDVRELTAVEHLYIHEKGEPVTLLDAKDILKAESIEILKEEELESIRKKNGKLESPEVEKPSGPLVDKQEEVAEAPKREVRKGRPPGFKPPEAEGSGKKKPFELPKDSGRKREKKDDVKAKANLAELKSSRPSKTTEEEKKDQKVTGEPPEKDQKVTGESDDKPLDKEE